jgi:hypothetical protein
LIPDNVKPDYLEGAFEIASEALYWLNHNSSKHHPLRIPKKVIKKRVEMVLNNQDENFDVPHQYHLWHKDGKLTFEFACKKEQEMLESKIRRIKYAIEDFFEQYDHLKQQQEPIQVYLDDNRVAPEEYDVHVYKIDHLINMLKYGNITHISLDNDLGSYSQEGYKVASHIEEQAFHGTLKPLSVFIHSANTVRHKEMTSAIGNANKFWNKKATQ